MAEIHNLNNLLLAKAIVREIPEALLALDKCEKNLNTYIKFRNIENVILAIKDAKTMLKMHLESQQQIINNRGRVE